MEPLPLPSIKPGERAIVAGRTGSGKTVLGGWLANRSRQRWVIFNPKHTAGYKTLDNAETVNGFDARKIEKALERSRFVDVRFDPDESVPVFMDACIGWLHERFDNVGLLVDELYAIHDSGRPLPGLTAWLTRGRERQQSFIGLTQRPKWISKFCFSEADYIAGMALQLEADRKAMVENTGRAEYATKLAPHYWLWYMVNADRLGYYGPVPLPSQQD